MFQRYALENAIEISGFATLCNLYQWYYRVSRFCRPNTVNSVQIMVYPCLTWMMNRILLRKNYFFPPFASTIFIISVAYRVGCDLGEI